MDIDRAIDSAETLLRQWAVRIDSVAPWRLDVLLPAKELPSAARILCGTEWGSLTGITMLEIPDSQGCCELIYDFRHQQALVCLRVRLEEITDPIPSLTPLCPCAEPFEQSFTERYGLKFV